MWKHTYRGFTYPGNKVPIPQYNLKGLQYLRLDIWTLRDMLVNRLNGSRDYGIRQASNLTRGGGFVIVAVCLEPLSSLDFVEGGHGEILGASGS